MALKFTLEDGDKSRHWAFEVYAEDWPEVYPYMLDTYIGFCWILHDHDTLEDGTPKKLHYHVMVAWGNNTTYKNCKRFFRECAANGYILKISSGKGYFDYMSHKSRPEKYQYDVNDIHFENGMTEDDIYSQADYDDALQDIDKIILNVGISDYALLLNYFYEDGNRFYVKVCHKSTVHLRELLKSVRCLPAFKLKASGSDQKDNEAVISDETGV